jgi:hypothetical protein
VAFTEKEPRDWENPAVFGINKEEPHASFISYADERAKTASVTKNIILFMILQFCKGEDSNKVIFEKVIKMTF